MAEPSPAAVEVLAITSGTYLRMRREAQGLTIEQVAQICMSDGVGMAAAVAAIEDAEADRNPFEGADLIRLLQAFSFAPSIYWQILEGLPFPPLCRVCACSWDDACVGRCAWTDPSHSLCTNCVGSPL
jgi:transcriptional regulator with XRE-family HTH domain